MHVAKRQWRKKKQTNRKKTSKLLCSSDAFFREYRVFSRTEEFKRRIWMLLSSLKHSPVSWFSFSLLRCILVCWRGTRTTLVPSNNIEACTTRSQLMARVPRSPSIANIASAQSFPRFSSQFFFFFFDVRIFRRTRLEDVSCARAELHLCEFIQGKTQ